MNTIKMKSVGELVRAAGNSSVERYKISSYQRGYRWKAEEQVQALLDDVKDFCQQQQQIDEIYCLQPIVVAKGQDEKGEFWEVIDGQQRLTIIRKTKSCIEGKRKVACLKTKRILKISTPYDITMPLCCHYNGIGALL